MMRSTGFGCDPLPAERQTLELAAQTFLSKWSACLFMAEHQSAASSPIRKHAGFALLSKLPVIRACCRRPPLPSLRFEPGPFWFRRQKGCCKGCEVSAGVSGASRQQRRRRIAAARREDAKKWRANARRRGGKLELTKRLRATDAAVVRLRNSCSRCFPTLKKHLHHISVAFIWPVYELV